MTTRVFKAIGLMSGTSMDGIDAALLDTDGTCIMEQGPSLTLPYTPAMRARLAKAIKTPEGKEALKGLEQDLTDLHADAVKSLCKKAGLLPNQVDLVGFHGHTIWHKPEQHTTWQIGDGLRLAHATGIDVVHDFRSVDMAAGGQGAPLVPLFHRAMAKDHERPLAILNIGGVANVTWLGTEPDDILAFDTGPGGALLDDFIKRATGAPYDKDGNLAATGTVHEDLLTQLLAHPFFQSAPPKSLDRGSFDAKALDMLSIPDGAATLTAFTAHAIAKASHFMPQKPARWLVCGGGRHNKHLMTTLAKILDVPVTPVEILGWNGDALEAQAFAFLAVRSLFGLPLTLPATTGTTRPITGGVLSKASAP